MSGGCCVVFGDGVEEIELVVPVDIARRCGLEVTLVAAKDTRRVEGAHGIGLWADTTLGEIGTADFGALVLPGGPGAFRLKDSDPVLTLVRNCHARNKLIAAICAAPLILWNAGILAGKKYCAHPCTHDVLREADRMAKVIVDGNLITGKGPGASVDFACSIVELLRGKRAAAEIRADLFF
jgi:4-methyl-5(b-hydroxyethyl)-thiazole monophosphate biosynthesis